MARIQSSKPDERPARPALFYSVLLSTALLDELASGFPIVALTLIRDDFGLSYFQLGLLFAVGQAASWLLEPPINLLSDRGSKRWPVLGGLLCLSLGFALAASASQFIWLLLAFAIIFPASGAAVGLSQATLIDRSLVDAPRTMTRWTLMAAIGDLLSPLIVAGAAILGFGWRPLFWLAAGLWLGVALIIWPQRFPMPQDIAGQDGATLSGGILTNVHAALRNNRLLRWIGVLLAADMLDEIFLGFAALYLRDVVGADPAAASLALAAHMAGALLGLFVLDRLISRLPGERLLSGVALLTLVGIVGLLLARSAWIASGALFLIGLGAASWYPIANAAAYAALPGRSGTVRAVTDLLDIPFNLALPIVVGAIAGWFGILAGVGFLGLAPVAVLLVAPRRR